MVSQRRAGFRAQFQTETQWIKSPEAQHGVLLSCITYEKEWGRQHWYLVTPQRHGPSSLPLTLLAEAEHCLALAQKMAGVTSL
jgi:hypothetical protein